MRPLPLRKSRRILRQAYAYYKRGWRQLAPGPLARLEETLAALDAALLRRDRKEASRLARDAQQQAEPLARPRPWAFLWEIVVAIAVALVVATVVRQMWFEPMEIPSGSMRPTFQELDRLIVTKDNFGVNVPMYPAHLYFDPDLVQRTGVFIFTAEGMDIADQDTRYFGIFPGKKRLIKRCMGKPGDVLYFYGGKIYGMDANGNLLTDYLDAPWLDGIDSIPYMNFAGKSAQIGPGQWLLKQFNLPVARLSLKAGGSVSGELNNGQGWVMADPSTDETGTLHTLGQLFGMRNYAMTRLLTREQLTTFGEASLIPEGSGDGLLYLELYHDPTLVYPAPDLRYGRGRELVPNLSPFVSVIPLDAVHLERLNAGLYTSRFVVSRGVASLEHRNQSGAVPPSYLPHFPQVPDGRYQIQDGVAYEVAWGGILRRLPPDHPLADRSPQMIQKLFNLGVEMLTVFQPTAGYQPAIPSRFAFFRDGALFVMGHPVFTADDSALKAFVGEERSRAAASTRQRPYLPFVDHGPPLKNGELDREMLQTFGLHVPEGGYLALGDNYAGSSDSRRFGFVPESNIRGAPLVILWPPGPRWGFPAQGGYPVFTLPRIIVWLIALVVLGGFGWLEWWRLRKPVYKKLS